MQLKHLDLLGTRILFTAVTLFAAALVGCDGHTPTQPRDEAAGPTAGGDLLSELETANATTFAGSATALRASTSLGSVATCSAGPLPPQGGAYSNAQLSASVSGVASASVLHASTIGQGDRTRSQSSSASIVILATGCRISAGFAISRAQAVCSATGVVLSGEAQISDLIVNGQRIVVTGQANQTVWLPLGLGRLVINERVTASGVITVRALRCVLRGQADVVISEARAGVVCGQSDCEHTGDFVTGGGWIVGTPSGEKGTFGVSGGIKNGSFWGHLTYIEHGAGGPRVKGTGVTNYVVVDATTRRIEGDCEINGQAGYRYSVEVSDNGEPGRDDVFRLRLSNGYQAGGTLGGGNIQLHGACR